MLITYDFSNALYALFPSKLYQPHRIPRKNAAVVIDPLPDSKTLRPIRLMHVIGTLGHGGLEQGVLKVVKGLDPNVFEQTICTVWSLDYMPPQSGIRVIALNRSAENTGYIGTDLLKVFRREKPQIVHSRNWPTIEAVLAARLARIPGVVHSEHGRDIKPLTEEPWRRKAFRRLSYRLADRVFMVSAQLKAEYEEALGVPSDLFRVIYNGVDTKRFSLNLQNRREWRQKIGATESSFVVGCVARLDRVKDHRTLLRGVQLAAGDGKDIRLVLVGEGPERAELEAEMNSVHGMKERVTFAGRSFDVLPWLNCFDAFVLPSRFEGISNTLLEAMSAHLPVVATRVGGNVEILVEGKSGLFFEPGDANTLATHLKHLAEDVKFRDRLASEARRRVEEKFRLESMMENYTNLYLQLIQKKEAPRKGRKNYTEESAGNAASRMVSF